jgi:hypothetical protein
MKTPSGSASRMVTPMVKRISAQPEGFMPEFLEFVGTEQGGDHVAGDEDRRGAIEQGNDHGQTLFRARA